MPVVRAEPPIVAAEVAGSVSERGVLDALFAGSARLTDCVEQHISPPLPTIGSTKDARDAVKLSSPPTRSSCTRTASRSAWSPAGSAGVSGPSVARPRA